MAMLMAMLVVVVLGPSTNGLFQTYYILIN